LDKLGHQATVIEVPRDWDRPFPEERENDINLFVGDPYMLWILWANGFPKAGRNILWMFDPLPEANIIVETAKKIARRVKPLVGMRKYFFHDGKTYLMKAIGHKFDAVIGLNSIVTSYIERCFPDIPTVEIPYTIDPKHIIRPVPESEKQIDILQLGNRSPRRERAEKLFNQRGIGPAFIYGGLFSEYRHEIISKSKISLHIHGAKPYYFSQHRIFEAWAAGSVVVSEPFFPEFEPVEKGAHLAVAEIEEFPEVCEELLEDRERRGRILAASQELLMDCFVPHKWSNKLLALFSSVV
jgi:hypothetical protein